MCRTFLVVTDKKWLKSVYNCTFTEVIAKLITGYRFLDHSVLLVLNYMLLMLSYTNTHKYTYIPKVLRFSTRLQTPLVQLLLCMISLQYLRLWHLYCEVDCPLTGTLGSLSKCPTPPNAIVFTNGWLGGITVTASDMRSSGHGFDSRSGRYQATYGYSAFHPSGIGISSTGLLGWGYGGARSLVSGGR